MSTWTRSSSPWKNCSIPRSRANPWWSADAPTSVAWSPPPPTRPANSASIPRCHCAPPTNCVPQAIFVEGHRDRYLDYSHKVFDVLQKFSPQVEMASIDEAYLDLTGTERLHGPPLSAAHRLHAMVKQATDLNCSIGAATSRLVAKIASDQAKPNGVLWIVPGREAEFLAPLDVRKIPGVGKVTEHNLHACGIRKVGDLAALDDAFLERAIRQMGSCAGRQSARRRRRRLVRRRSRRRQRAQIDQP